MSETTPRNEAIDALLSERIAAGDFPGAAYLVSLDGIVHAQGALGDAIRHQNRVTPCSADTIFDVASLTKPVVTGLLLAIAVRENKIDFNDRLSRFFPELEIDDADDVTIEQLAKHTSGFTAWIPFYLEIENEISREEKLRRAVDLILNKEPVCAPDSKVIYSDLNFILLGIILERIFGERLDVIASNRVFSPLGLKRTFFNPPSELGDEIAASEFGNGHEKKTCEEMGYDTSHFNWREYLIRGEVHDGNCKFFNGISGHAGLFSTIDDLNKLSLQFIPGRSILLDDATIETMTRNRTPQLNEHRSIAFQIASTPDSTASTSLDGNSFGHLGFTGTSLWIDPMKKMAAILLTNRTHDHSLPFVNIKEMRRRFNELAARSL
jgi:CubicO group peptidase (beta-lactamase class C family)